MFRNSLYRPSPLNPMPRDIMPTNIDAIVVNTDKSIVIHKIIDLPGEELFKKQYLLSKPAHINIALKVLCGELSAQDGKNEFVEYEGLYETLDALKFPLGQLLESLIPQSWPDNKRIRYIDEDVQKSVINETALTSSRKSF